MSDVRRINSIENFANICTMYMFNTLSLSVKYKRLCMCLSIPWVNILLNSGRGGMLMLDQINPGNFLSPQWMSLTRYIANALE